MALSLNPPDKPGSWKQAINVTEWEAAMRKAVDELKSKNAWKFVRKSADTKVLPGVWNSRTKRDENGNVVKYKARWCVDGSREGFTRPPESVLSPVA